MGMIQITKKCDSSKLNLFNRHKLHAYDIVGQQKCVVMIINHTIKRRKYLKIFWFCFIHRNLTRIQMYIVSWPNTKHWLMIHISIWVMIIKWSAWLHDKCHACKHIEAETRWPPFPRRRFQMHFLIIMKMCEYRLRFHWSLFLGVQTTISQHWFR